MGNIIELKQSDGTKAYPITLAEAVYMADGSTAENEITELKNDLGNTIDGVMNTLTSVSAFTVMIGGINPNGGNYGYNDTRCRTQYIGFTDERFYYVVIENPDYDIERAFAYTTAAQGTVIGALQIFNKKAFCFKSDANAKYLRFSFVHSTNVETVMTDEDVAAIAASIKFYIFTDTSLSVSGAAADAKAVRDAIDNVNDAIDNAEREILYSDGNPFMWAVGGIAVSTGANLSATNRLRSGFYTADNIKKIAVPDGYYLSFYAYNSPTSEAYVGVWDGSVFIKTSNYRLFNVVSISDLPDFNYFRLVLRHADETDIAIAENTNCTVDRNTDTTLTDTGISADAGSTGNALISAAEALCKWIYSPDFSVIFGGISVNGTDSGVTTRMRTQYIDIVPGRAYHVMLNSPDYTMDVAYTYSGASGQNAIRNLDILRDGRNVFFKAGETETKLRISFLYAADKDHEFTTGEEVIIKAAIEIRHSVEKLPRTGDFEFFSVTVDRPLPYNDESYTTGTESIECVLRLPLTYTADGVPTRLVFMAHGAQGYIEAADDHWYGTHWKQLCDDLLAAGYALFDTNTLSEGSKNPNVIGYGTASPLYTNNVKRAYDYIQAHYNVYPEIFCHGTSMGGTGASSFSHVYPKLVLAESSFAGRDILFYLWRIDEGVAEDRFAQGFGYADLDELNADKFSRVEGVAPSLSLKKINDDGTISISPDRETNYSGWIDFWADLMRYQKTENPGRWVGKRSVPYKAWNSWEDDAKSTKLEEILQQAFSTGSACPYYIVNYETGTHDDMCFGQVNNMSAQLISWYKRWE